MKKLTAFIVTLALAFTSVGCSLEIKKPEILKNETKDKVSEDTNFSCSAEFYEGSYYEYLDPYDEMRWMNGLTVHIENMDEHGFDIYVTDDSPEKGKEVILERRRAIFASTGYEAVCEADPETDILKETSVIRIFLIETGKPAAVTALVLSGFEPCRWKVFVNNTIPGHQFN